MCPRPHCVGFLAWMLLICLVFAYLFYKVQGGEPACVLLMVVLTECNVPV